MEQAKTPLTEEQKMRRRVARLLGRTSWFQEYKAQNPTATKEERDAAWKDARKEATKRGSRLMKVLTKRGFSVTHTPVETVEQTAAE